MTETTKAIIFLGVKPIDTNYVFPDGREYIAPFFGIALANFVPGLRMRVFVTATTKKESLPTLQCAVAKFVTDIQSVDIPDGRNDEELWAIFQAVVDAVDPGEQLIFDITHGFRSLPFLSFLAVAYLRVVKNIQLKGVYYGNFEARDQSVTPNRTPVIDLTPFVDLLDWTAGADHFVRFGDASELARLLRTQHERVKPDLNNKVAMSEWGNSPVKKTAAYLERASRALRVLRPNEAMDASAQICAQLPEALKASQELAHPLLPLGEHVRNSFTPIARSENEQSKNPAETLKIERQLIKWYLDRNQIFLAVALAREWLVSWVMVQIGMCNNLLEKSEREKVERALGQKFQQMIGKSPVNNNDTALSDLEKLHNLDTIVQCYNQLGDLRNDLMHAGKRKSPRAAEKVEEQAKELIKELEKLLHESEHN
jgi:CRISPR-associated DxTHG motif protein